MDILLSVAAFLLSAIGIVGCIVPGVPGVVLGYAGLLCASFCSYSRLPASLLWIWLGVTVVGTAADFVLPGYMTRLAGGTRAGVWGATAGMIVGFLCGGFVGAVLGPFFGAVVGELLRDRRDSARAFRSGFGSFLAFVVGTGLKLAAAGWMLGYVWADTWPVVKSWFETVL
ncbi:MAG: DUF456 domain-containing protein [Alistipes sp.]|nr:DUF456 domain-containing protein [Alistipes sp.]